MDQQMQKHFLPAPELALKMLAGCEPKSGGGLDQRTVTIL